MLDAGAPLPDNANSLREVALDIARATRARQRRMEQEQRDAKRALEELAQQQSVALSLLEATLSATPGGVVAVNLSGRVRVWNPHFAQLWQVPLELMSQRNFQEIGAFCAAQLEEPEKWFPSTGQLIEASQREFSLKDGRVLECHLAPKMIEGTQTGFVMHWQDITERVTSLRQLQASQLALKRSNTDLEQFAYGASHDLQEPLRSIAGSLQLLQRRYSGVLDAHANELIHHAVSGAKRMSTLITDILNYSRLNASARKLTSVALNDVLNIAYANLAAAVQESSATLTHDELPTLVVERLQMTQLFQNLIGNAIKFRGNKPASVHVGVKREKQEWVISVVDQGIGIPPEQFQRIFSIFRRLHTQEEYAGTGIGLALCQKIVQRHGGRIWVESEVGQGSAFYFTLPFSHPDAPAG